LPVPGKQAKDESAQQVALHDLSIFYTDKELDFVKASNLLNMMKGPESIYNLRLDLALDPNLPYSKQIAMLQQLLKDFPDKSAYTHNWIANLSNE
jgi:hypothetical protein